MACFIDSRWNIKHNESKHSQSGPASSVMEPVASVISSPGGIPRYWQHQQNEAANLSWESNRVLNARWTGLFLQSLGHRCEVEMSGGDERCGGDERWSYQISQRRQLAGQKLQRENNKLQVNKSTSHATLVEALFQAAPGCFIGWA